MTVRGIHNAIAAIKYAGWDQVRDGNGEEFLVEDLDATDEGDESQYAIDADAVVRLRDEVRAETVWTRIN